MLFLWHLGLSYSDNYHRCHGRVSNFELRFSCYVIGRDSTDDCTAASYPADPGLNLVVRVE